MTGPSRPVTAVAGKTRKPLQTPAPAARATRILGMGHYRPGNVVTNQDLIARGVDTDDEWIRSRVGIAQRRYASPDETVVDMAESAARKAIAAAGVAAEEIDMVLVATCTMPTPVPSAAPVVATRLGIVAPGAYDINSGCSGFVYALNVASSAILTGSARNVLVIASERFSGWLDFTDRSTCIILGDAAGAAVVGASDIAGFGPVVWGSDGSGAHDVTIDPVSRTFRQEGAAVYRWATSAMTAPALLACERAGITAGELAAFIPHQANLRIIDSLAKKLDAPQAVVARDIETSGNTSAASIPLAMSRLIEAGRISSGDPVLLVGFGAGLAYAAQVVLCP